MIKGVRGSEAIIHIFCKSRGIPGSQISSSPFASEVEKAIKQYVLDCGQKAMEGVDFQESIQGLITELIHISSDSHFEHECKLIKAIANHERSNLRQCLREALLDSGYNLIHFSDFSQEKYLKKSKMLKKK